MNTNESMGTAFECHYECYICTVLIQLTFIASWCGLCHRIVCLW